MKHGRLIDADALMPRLEFIREAEHQIFYGKESWGFVSKCITAVEDAPTIEERKTGEWISGAENFNTNYSHECSQCGALIDMYHGGADDYYFCPNCGAKMEETE